MHILINGLDGNRPCVAQIMSWAAHRTTTRVEDRAYSLMGLLDVNMPMLYGEGKKAFHRLQLEVIRVSDDLSIFAWFDSERAGSILADDPRFFASCGRMELMGHDEFIQFLKEEEVPEEELDSIEDRFGTFPITNRGIQIWMLLRPYRGSCSIFEAWLPCRGGPMQSPVAIELALWESNYYRCPLPYFGLPPTEGPPELRQVYLRYQDLPHRIASHRIATFEIDDSALTEDGFTCCNAYPMKFIGNSLTLTSTDSLCIKTYSDSLSNHRFEVCLGQSFGKHWIHVVSNEYNLISGPLWDFFEYIKMKFRTLEAMNKARSGAERYGRIYIMQTRLSQRTKVLQISSVMWKNSRTCGVKLQVFHDPGFGDVSGEWTAFDVDVGSFLHV